MRRGIKAAAIKNDNTLIKNVIMQLSIPPIVAYIASWLGILGAIRALFGYIEGQLESDAKSKLAKWIANLDLARAVSGWPESFVAIFDSVFGKRHFSWRCFARSSLASVVAVIILFCIVAAIHPEQIAGIFNQPDMPPVLVVVIYLAVSNIITDYMSLLETRALLQWLHARANMTRTIGIVILDFIATGTIWFVMFPISIAIFGSVAEWRIPSLADIETVISIVWLEDSLAMFTLETKGAQITTGIFFYSTYFTSIWVWLYVTAAVFAATGKFLGKWFRFFRSIFKLTVNPLQFLGIMASIVVTLIYLIIPFVR